MREFPGYNFTLVNDGIWWHSGGVAKPKHIELQDNGASCNHTSPAGELPSTPAKDVVIVVQNRSWRESRSSGSGWEADRSRGSPSYHTQAPCMPSQHTSSRMVSCTAANITIS